MLNRIGKLIWLVGVSAFVLLTAGRASANRGEIIVSAAASLTNVMGTLGKDFERLHPGAKVIFNFGATGDLLAQISQGAPVDVFFSANEKYMDKAEGKGLIDPVSRKDFAGNVLVLARPATGQTAVSGLRDLTRPQVKRIAIGKPETVPAGQYAEKVLRAAGMWEAVQPKLIFASSVRQALDYLQRGEVDCGLVYATDVKVTNGQVTTVAEMPGTKVLYPVALTKAGSGRQSARMFLSYLDSDAARATLRQAGFLLP